MTSRSDAARQVLHAIRHGSDADIAAAKAAYREVGPDDIAPSPQPQAYYGPDQDREADGRRDGATDWDEREAAYERGYQVVEGAWW